MPALQVSQINLLSSLGQATTLKTGRHDVAALRLAGLPGQTRCPVIPCCTPVQSMLVGGTNVVHAGVERFSPSQTPRSEGPRGSSTR